MLKWKSETPLVSCFIGSAASITADCCWCSGCRPAWSNLKRWEKNWIQKDFTFSDFQEQDDPSMGRTVRYSLHWSSSHLGEHQNNHICFIYCICQVLLLTCIPPRTWAKFLSYLSWYLWFNYIIWIFYNFGIYDFFLTFIWSFIYGIFGIIFFIPFFYFHFKDILKSLYHHQSPPININWDAFSCFVLSQSSCPVSSPANRSQYKYTNTNTQIQIHKYKHKCKYMLSQPSCPVSSPANRSHHSSETHFRQLATLTSLSRNKRQWLHTKLWLHVQLKVPRSFQYRIRSTIEETCFFCSLAFLSKGCVYETFSQGYMQWLIGCWASHGTSGPSSLSWQSSL